MEPEIDYVENSRTNPAWFHVDKAGTRPRGHYFKWGKDYWYGPFASAEEARSTFKACLEMFPNSFESGNG